MADKTPAPPAPKPAPVAAPQGAQGPRTALAPTLVEMPKDAPDPQKDFSARLKGALDKAAASRAKAELDGAGEDAAPSPKGESVASKAEPSANAPGADAKKQSDKPSDQADPSKADSKESQQKPSTPSTEQSSAKEPKFTLKAIKRWAEENPEEAAEVRKQIFELPEDPTGAFVALQNKRRKLRAELKTEREKMIAEAKAEREAASAAQQAVEKAAKNLQPMADLWDACRKNPEHPDFEAGDAAFAELAGMTFDHYSRLRARRGLAAPGDAKLRAENARLKRELEAGKPKAEEAPAAAKAPEAKEEPKTAPKAKEAPTESFADDLPDDHKLRAIAGWEDKLSKAMTKYYDADLEEYSQEVEVVADKLLKKELAALTESEDDDEPAPKRPVVKKKPKRAPANAKQVDPNEPEDEDAPAGWKDSRGAPARWQDRVAWATKRAQERAQAGE